MEIYLFSRDDMVIKIIENSIKSMDLPLRVFTNFDPSFIESDSKNTLILMDDSISNFSSITKSKFPRILIHRKSIPQLEGFSGYVSKPFLPRDIIDAVNGYMTRDPDEVAREIEELEDKDNNTIKTEQQSEQRDILFDFEQKFRDLERELEGVGNEQDALELEAPEEELAGEAKRGDFLDFSLENDLGDENLDEGEFESETDDSSLLDGRTTRAAYELASMKSAALEALKSIDLEELESSAQKDGELSSERMHDNWEVPEPSFAKGQDQEEIILEELKPQAIESQSSMNSFNNSILAEKDDEIEELKQLLREASIPKTAQQEDQVEGLEQESSLPHIATDIDTTEGAKLNSELKESREASVAEVITRAQQIALDSKNEKATMDDTRREGIKNQIKQGLEGSQREEAQGVETKAQLMAKVDQEINQISIDESDMLEALNRPLIDRFREHKDINMDGDDFIDFIKDTPREELKGLFGSGRVNLFINFKG